MKTQGKYNYKALLKNKDKFLGCYNCITIFPIEELYIDTIEEDDLMTCSYCGSDTVISFKENSVINEMNLYFIKDTIVNSYLRHLEKVVK